MGCGHQLCSRRRSRSQHSSPGRIDICGGRCVATAPAVAALDGIIVIVGDDSVDLLRLTRAVATLPHRETRAHRMYPLLGACGSPPCAHLEPSLLVPCHLALLIDP